MHHDHDTTEYIYTDQFHQISPFSNARRQHSTCEILTTSAINPIYSLISLGGVVKIHQGVAGYSLMVYHIKNKGAYS